MPPDYQCLLHSYLVLTFSVTWVEIDGITYSHGSIVVLVPVFGEIKDIIVDEQHSCYFVCDVLETCQFVSHFHAYEVSPSSPLIYRACRPSDLYDHTVLSKYTISSVHYIPLKYQIFHNEKFTMMTLYS